MIYRKPENEYGISKVHYLEDRFETGSIFVSRLEESWNIAWNEIQVGEAELIRRSSRLASFTPGVDL